MLNIPSGCCSHQSGGGGRYGGGAGVGHGSRIRVGVHKTRVPGGAGVWAEAGVRGGLFSFCLPISPHAGSTLPTPCTCCTPVEILDCSSSLLGRLLDPSNTCYHPMPAGPLVPHVPSGPPVKTPHLLHPCHGTSLLCPL